MAATQLPFDLVETKLAAPFSRPGTVAKADLIERLCETSVPFVCVVAPAGYGKTTLLARWAEADPRPFAWVALDGRDDDDVVFLRYIAAAIHRVEPVTSDVFDSLTGRGGGGSWAMRVPRVGSALATVERPLVLVLDDLHAISNPSCLDALAELFQYVPAGSLIAIASRDEPALPLARWRAGGSVCEIGVPDLQLDEQEADLLLEAAGAKLDTTEVHELTERTEGWPAGLYLAALSIRAGGLATGPRGFTSDDRFVSEYFRLELLSRLPADEAKFLLYTSVLDRMCGPLCDSLLETTGTAQTLAMFERRNRFLVPLDRRGEWYRYHHLFGQLLRNQLGRSEPEVVPLLNRLAMDWCIANDLPEEAVAYGHAAGETRIVAGLIDALAPTLYYDGRRETAEEWLGWFSDDELAQYPALAVFGAWFHALTGRTADAERWLALAEGATSTIPLSDGSATIEPWVAVLRANMMRNGVEQSLADANLALNQLPTESSWVSTALYIRGIANALLGAIDRATDDLMATVEKGLASGAFEEAYLAQAQLALFAANRGAWVDAAQYMWAAQALVEKSGLGDYSTSAIVHAVTARVALHNGRHEEARTALIRAHRLRPALNQSIPWFTVQVGLELTRAHLALGEATAARTILTETEHVLDVRPRLGSLVEEARELRKRVAATAGPAGAWAMSLTGAELRLLPYLATHLTFPEIAARLFLSPNTIKTEAISTYRKLGASSRSQAIERAVDFGLLESFVYPERANLIPDG